MARKMTEINARLFEKLRCLLPDDYQHTQPNLKHWLKTSKNEKNWLRNVRFEKDETLKFGDSQQLGLALLDGNTYLICIGLKPSIANIDFEHVQLNSGLFCAAIVELDIRPLVSESIGLELADSIFIPATENTTVGIEHEFIEISKYFPELSIYIINPQSPY